MRLCRFQKNGRSEFGFCVDDATVVSVSDAALATGQAPVSAETILDLLPGGKHAAAIQRLQEAITADVIQQCGTPADVLKLLVPVAAPGKIILLAGNYADHIREGGGKAAERNQTFPYLFMKPNSTLTNPGDPIRIPSISPNEIDWEIELGVIIGRTCTQVRANEALGYVAGYTVVNDVSDRAFIPNPQRTPRPRDTFFDWQHGKWHDTFCPMGPCVLPANECADPQDLRMVLSVNGQVEQDGTTGDMVFPVRDILEFISSFVTLHPGDVICTGTPAGVGKAKGRFLKPNDVVTAKIDHIGTLVNPVAG
ncbi:fumarylacetoacetate hydrolase family protein [Planctomicrobium sp. SH527]|uniref:fumarylacetoacetate hydrolase family protein n=1 Tax=Planctomicrobium sp. SH527 TaxID=3448123 RepID=UPI003F5C22E7